VKTVSDNVERHSLA